MAESDFSKIFRNSFILGFGHLISALLLFVLLLLVARFLGPVSLGKYSFAVAIAAVLTAIVELGLDNLTVREVARDKKLSEKYSKHSFIARIILSAILLTILFLVILFFGYWDDVFIILTISVYALMKTVSMSFKTVFRAHERMEFEAMPLTAAAVIVAFLGGIFLYSGFGINGVGIAFMLGGIFELGISILFFRRMFSGKKVSWDTGFFKKIMANATPFWVSALLIAVYFATDIVMLSFLLGSEKVGIYSAAYRPIIATLFIAGPIFTSLYPKLSQFSKQKKEFNRIFWKSIKLFLGISLPITLISIVFSQELVLLLYGIGFNESVNVFRILGLLPVFLFANLLVSGVLNAKDKQKTNMKIFFLVTIINIGMNFILIKEFGLIGAGYATIISQIVFLVLSSASLILISRKA